MKTEHLSTIEANLPSAMPQIQQVLKDNGLGHFIIKNLELIHEDFDPCGGRCNPATEQCVQVLRGGRMVWDCQPIMDDGD